eukprot:6538517-Prymnesium_polylepis.1
MAEATTEDKMVTAASQDLAAQTAMEMAAVAKSLRWALVARAAEPQATVQVAANRQATTEPETVMVQQAVVRTAVEKARVMAMGTAM